MNDSLITSEKSSWSFLSLWYFCVHLLGTDKPREARDLNRTLEVKPSPSVSTSHRCIAFLSLSLSLVLSCFFTAGLAQIQVCRSTPAKLSASSDIHKLPNSHSHNTHFRSVLILFLDDVHTLFCECVAKHLSSHLSIVKQMSRCAFPYKVHQPKCS